MSQLPAILRALSRRIKHNLEPAAQSPAIARYLAGGRRPWSEGYWEYREQYSDTVLKNSRLMQRFRAGQRLPAGYGVRLDERTVEYPWLLSQLVDRPGSILDAGATLNYRYLLRQPALKQRNVCVCSLTLETEHRPSSRVTYLLADLRYVPFRDGCFDNIVCLSTLEHIGMNSMQVYGAYGATEHYREHEPTSYRLALHEFRRLLAPGGRLFLTVPFGEREEFGWLQQFNPAMIDDVMAAFDGQVEDLSFFRYAPAGWQRASMAECSTARYFDIHREPNLAPDYAAAARAVACLALVKKPSVSRTAGAGVPATVSTKS